MSDLEEELKALIIESLNLEELSIDDINSNDTLFGEGLGLDSIDALELGLAIYKKYNVKFNSEDNSKAHFASVAVLAKYIQEQLDERET